jgi:hypothetical protein
MTITPGFWDFTIYKGATFTYALTWKNSDCSPVDLSGATAILEARSKVSDENPFMTLTTENGGIVISDPETGIIQLYYSATDTEELDAVRGVYDLQVNFNAGQDVGYLLQGKMTVQEMVVRP